MRDLENDLKFCEAVIKEPWEYCSETTYCGDYPCSISHKVKIGQELITISCHAYDYEGEAAEGFKAMFIARATKGWPEAIKRAIAAEKERDDMRVSMANMLGAPKRDVKKMTCDCGSRACPKTLP